MKNIKLPAVDRRNRNLKIFSIASTAIFLAILLVFNIVFDKLLGEKLKWDWTSGQMYSIGEVSREILKNNDQPVTITGLFDQDQAANFGFTSILPMLDDYVAAGNGLVDVRYIDPDKTPSVLREIDPTGYLGAKQGDFVVTSEATGKGKVVGYDAIFQMETDYTTYATTLTGVKAEQSLTGAINYVLSTTTPTIYFTTGHEETDFEGDFSVLVGLLRNNNFAVQAIDLFGGAAVPDDCAVLVLADPRKDITSGEAQVIADYLEKGGSLMVMASFSTTSFVQLNNLLLDYDIAISDDKIREGDKDHRLNDDPYILRAIAPAGTITAQLVDGFTFLDNVRSIRQLSSGKSYLKVEPLLTSSEQGVIETGGDPAASSVPGTQTIALLSENQGFIDSSSVTEPARVIVTGSSSIFRDELLDQYGQNIYNAGLFFYSIQWLAGEDAIDALYIEAKTPPNYAVVSGNTTINVLTAILAMVLIPMLLIILAVVVYRRRKNL